MLPALRAVRLFALAVLPTLFGCVGTSPDLGPTEPADVAPSARGLPVLEGPLLIATWPFGRVATDEALREIARGGSRLDVIEAGIREVERWSCDGTVGIGGGPNAAGYQQLDACIMDGPGQRAGSVAGVEGIVHPITAARHVMEDSKHVMLVGEGARWFALEHGVKAVSVDRYAEMKRRWLEEPRGARESGGHDTITLLLKDKDGHIAGGCSSSGARGKLPGRVGDAPILGGGLYVDDEVGAAGATGAGENVMRYCTTFLVVENMRRGMHPQLACEEALHRVAAIDPLGYKLNVCLIALDRMGRYGAASSSSRFPFVVATEAGSRLLHVAKVTPRNGK